MGTRHAKTAVMLKVAVASLVASSLALSAGRAAAQPTQPMPPPAPAETPATVIIIEPGAAPPPGAAPATTAPAAGPAGTAPTNEPWNNVSHINGTPVPVGSRNEYLYEFRKTMISANPVAWMFEIYGISISHALSDNIALHGDITLYSGDMGNGTEMSLGLPIYLRRAYQGPFCEPGVLMRRSERDGSAFGPQVLLGWQWTYDSGWSLAVAGGVARDVSGNDEYTELMPNGYVRMGYAF